MLNSGLGFRVQEDLGLSILNPLGYSGVLDCFRCSSNFLVLRSFPVFFFYRDPPKSVSQGGGLNSRA